MIFRITSRKLSHIAKFVPKSQPVTNQDIEELAEFIKKSQNLLVLTGAGISTESGIPDYRSEEVGLYARSNRRPVDYQQFKKYTHIRQRFWARNHVGWKNFSSTQPNISHKILSKWEKEKKMNWLITQNVDSLHTKAGSVNVTELHGCSFRVICMVCHWSISRKELSQSIELLNPNWSAETEEIAPDGDVLISDDLVKKFNPPCCKSCGGELKPDVVFFGDNVKKPIVDNCMKKLAESDAFLVLGSSLEVYSGYRFLKRASEYGKPIGIVNIGKTRGDHLAQIKIDAQCGTILQAVDNML
ncbi:DgyrCDS7635 [Dimorphilus gyrociliatus]|uniref:NAD-dependent protein deacylase n=1 Tax=Dimorphilus gyrociliatus TaxID=2664684 RepID=A0A7I8VTB5_9ANNE|nr:DgyrCDS7635 [Dimorphilus gyrociliatus]